MSDIAIRVENLSKLYHIGALRQRDDTLRDALTGMFRRGQNGARSDDDTNLWALKDVSFEVKRGEVVGIIGRNGAGKSTLLKILSRITEPTSGHAEIHGRVGSLLEVGTGFHPELTGRENIFLNGAILGMHRVEIQRRFDEIVAFAEIERFLETPVKRYSSGMYVRLAFAVAAHLEPEILLVDEVLAVGDVAFQKKCLGKMGDVAKEGRTVLFISHNVAAIRSLCERVLLIENGQVDMDCDADTVTAAYMDRQSTSTLCHTVTFEKPLGLSAWVTRLTLLCNGKPSARVRMGDQLALQVNYGADKPIAYPSVGFVISSAQGDSLINANNVYQRSDPLLTPTINGALICKMGVLPLMENKYVVTIWFGADEASQHQHLENCLTFEVSEHDVWGKGKFPTKRISAMWWPTTFEATLSINYQSEED